MNATVRTLDKVEQKSHVCSTHVRLIKLGLQVKSLKDISQVHLMLDLNKSLTYRFSR